MENYHGLSNSGSMVSLKSLKLLLVAFLGCCFFWTDFFSFFPFYYFRLNFYALACKALLALYRRRCEAPLRVCVKYDLRIIASCMILSLTGFVPFYWQSLERHNIDFDI